MPSIDGCDLPDDLLLELKRLINEASPESLISYARSHPEAVRGFQLKKSSAPHIRKYLLNRFPAAGELNDNLKEFLVNEGFNNRFIAVLSETVLRRYFEELLTLYGRPEFITGLLLDSREPVRKLAADFLMKDDGGSRSNIPVKGVDIRVLLGPFIELLTSRVPESALGEATQKIEELEEEAHRWKQKEAESASLVKEMRKRIKKLEKSQGKYDKHTTAQYNELSREMKRLQVENETLKRSVNQEFKRREETELALNERSAEKQTLQDKLESTIRDRITTEMQSITRRWLNEPLRRDQAAAYLRENQQPNDLLEWVETVLDKQETVDRHSGNRRLLNDRLGRLRQAYKRIQQAATETLNPLPELAGCEDKLRNEINSIEQTLGCEDKPVSAIVSTLLTRINTTSSGPDLKKIRYLLHMLDAMDVLTPAELRSLYSQYHTTMARLYDTYAQQETDRPAFEDPVWRLCRDISTNSPYLLILDGHNVLYSLSDLFGISPNTESSRQAEGRNRLAASVAAIFKPAKQCEARIYFDGPERSDHMFGLNVKIIYSGGTGKNRADKAIVEYIEYLRQSSPDIPVLLVTNDRELIQEAEQLKVKPVSTQQFGALLDEYV